jgi:hypothetical protein
MPLCNGAHVMHLSHAIPVPHGMAPHSNKHVITCMELRCSASCGTAVRVVKCAAMCAYAVGCGPWAEVICSGLWAALWAVACAAAVAVRCRVCSGVCSCLSAYAWTTRGERVVNAWCTRGIAEPPKNMIAHPGATASHSQTFSSRSGYARTQAEPTNENPTKNRTRCATEKQDQVCRENH